MKEIKGSYDIAALILKESFSITRDSDLLYSDEQKYFFSSELSFYLFFLIAGNCLKDNLCDKDFITGIENELALFLSKEGNNSSDDYKDIIRNRFIAYRDTTSDSKEERAKERENTFLHFVKEDIKNNGFSLINISDYNASELLSTTINNPLHRVLYNIFMKELLEDVDLVIEEIKKNKYGLPEDELDKIRKRDKNCVYCHKKM